MDGFTTLLVDALVLNNVPEDTIYTRSALELPGFFRATKQWDIVVVRDGQLLVAIELKSQVGSFGNNVNNRVEEAVGSATDLCTALREGAFGALSRPWVGYVFLLEDCPSSTKPVTVKEPHFAVFPEFRHASYAKRYEELCRRIVREKLYSEASFLMTSRGKDGKANLVEPAKDLGFRRLVESMAFHVRRMLDAQTASPSHTP